MNNRLIRMFTETYTQPDTNRTVKHYEVYHRSSGNVVGRSKDRTSARRMVDKHDNKHGGYAHAMRPVYEETEDMNESEALAKHVSGILDREGIGHSHVTHVKYEGDDHDHITMGTSHSLRIHGTHEIHKVSKALRKHGVEHHHGISQTSPKGSFADVRVSKKKNPEHFQEDAVPTNAVGSGGIAGANQDPPGSQSKLIRRLKKSSNVQG